ncbi:hypothetical protein DKT68_02340 [Micromonospora acroterricola]|uniref:Uncharacterized protein n=1 Tax=Micromonospora acroterricola TaxID=2202421 RepID=A0A317DDH0_9ACTN|nr:DUF6114 domain-containing protein [Micromonospora acroterricola]PWR12788.1 hypothetical protein DKT68_02340 [Micromonospora acroterricola]
MTTANPSHARPGGLAQAWRSFRRWQRSRPFWGGLFTALAGVEMFASTRVTINGLSFHSGATGLLSLLIPVILVTCGLLLWLSPAQRLFYSVVAAVTTVYSLIGLNLGGFFVGLLLGMVGSALAFAWAPTRPAPPDAEQLDPEQTDADRADADRTGIEQDPADGTDAERADAEQDRADAERADAEQDRADAERVDAEQDRADVERVDAERTGGDHARVDDPTVETPQPDGPPEQPGRSADPRTFAIVLVVLGVAAAGLATQPRPVQAASARPTASACPTPSRAVTPSPSRSAPTATPTASPSPAPERDSDGNLISDILDGIGDLLTGGRRADTATPSAGPTGTPSAKPTATPTRPPVTRPGPTACPSPTPTRPAEPGTVEPGKPLPRIAADPTLPRVAQMPSKLTGSKVTMTGLRFDGTTELQTEKGHLKVLKFSMREAVTDDFLLVADGPQGRTQRYATDRLTVRGDVAFYSTRFVGRLLGIKITLTPDLPLPDGLPVTSPIPITFTDPDIDLAFVTSDTLTARPALALTLG